MRLQSMWLRAATITPIRLVLGVAWLLAAMAAGARTGPALVAWLLGAFGLAFAALNDPRARLLHRDPDPLPEGVEVELEPLWRHALASLFPSTFGLSLLAAIAI